MLGDELRKARENAGLTQEVVVTAQRTLDDVDDIIDAIRELLVTKPAASRPITGSRRAREGNAQVLVAASPIPLGPPRPRGAPESGQPRAG